jgi:hypothetical protein
MLRSKRARFRTLDVPLAARNRALDYLAKNYRLTDELRYQLTEVVNATVRRRRRASRDRVDARAISGGRADAAVLDPGTLARNRTLVPERTSRCRVDSKAPAGFSFPLTSMSRCPESPDVESRALRWGGTHLHLYRSRFVGTGLRLAGHSSGGLDSLPCRGGTSRGC